jgi:DNA-binding Lrp family transcriptional regulator
MTGLPKLDRIDLKILCHLQENGRATNVKLADAVGLSTSPCLQRVRRLERAGYIVRYRALIDVAKVADHVTIFTEVTLTDHRREDFIKFEAEIRKFDAVVECHLISGGYDYLLKFAATSILHYQDIIERVLDRNIGVKKYFSYVVIKSIIDKGGIPLKAVLPPGD